MRRSSTTSPVGWSSQGASHRACRFRAQNSRGGNKYEIFSMPTLSAGRLVVIVLVVTGLTVVRSAPVVEWRSQTSGVTGRLRGVSAVSARTAWASGANGTVLRTVDGGRTWQQLRVAGAESLDFRDVDAISDRVAYVLS